MAKLYLHTLPERIWHGTHAVLVLLLILSGIQIHWPDHVALFGSFSSAIAWHNALGLLLVADFLFWLAYTLASKRIIHYRFRKGEIHPGMVLQARYYLYDIFVHKPHPFAATEDNKFNPLQKGAYILKMFIWMPLLLASGLIYLFPSFFAPIVSLIGGLKVVATVHFLMAILFTSMYVGHIYLATTGHTVLAEFETIVSGYKEEEPAGVENT